MTGLWGQMVLCTGSRMHFCYVLVSYTHKISTRTQSIKHCSLSFINICRYTISLYLIVRISLLLFFVVCVFFSLVLSLFLRNAREHWISSPTINWNLAVQILCNLILFHSFILSCEPMGSAHGYEKLDKDRRTHLFRWW